MQTGYCISVDGKLFLQKIYFQYNTKHDIMKHLHFNTSMLFRMLPALFGLFVTYSSFGLTKNTNDSYKHQSPSGDSVYLKSYERGRNGLYFSYSTDQDQWTEIGPNHRFLGCDYGPWGAEKKMFSPFLMQDAQGLWHCVWSLNHYDARLAHAASYDLIHWKRQSYPEVMSAFKGGNCLAPQLRYQAEKELFTILWSSCTNGKDTTIYYTQTKDFKNYAPSREASPKMCAAYRKTQASNEGKQHRVGSEVLAALQEKCISDKHRQQLYDERAAQDMQRFADLKPLQADIRLNLNDRKVISDMLMGIFFEDINYAADGGLYAELVQNRGFEYAHDIQSHWHALTAWLTQGDVRIDTLNALHPNNPHYALLSLSGKQETCRLINEGFDGIHLEAGESYRFSVFAKAIEGKGKLHIRLVDSEGKDCGQSSIKPRQNTWKKYTCILRSDKDVENARLEITYTGGQSIALDMVSLFPQNTFKNRPNGLRADLAQSLADLHPRFVRFPGGCVAHGNGLQNMYRWKNTIGPLEARKPQRNIWGYHQSVGLGYFEYFQFCEDIGAEPLPIVPAGVPCQNSAHGGQQGGIPMEEMDDYVQEILDLIEYANGSPQSYWGKKRAKAGHPEPFHLKYLGMGNEDLITDVFEERFCMIYKALQKKHPEITVIGTVGPFYEGSDYDEGWDLAKRLQIPIVDEHYYVSPGWFIYNQSFYDHYDRSGPKVYLGEYASHLPDRPNNLETALSEALYLTAVERNADIVRMCSYAPLLAKEGHTQWNPDLIYFNNKEVKPTVGYYVQQMYGQHSGNVYLQHELRLSDNRHPVKCRVASSAVLDTETGDMIIKLVNMLPVAVSANLHIDGETKAFSSSAAKIVLSGRPADKDCVPQQGSIVVGKDFLYEMPAYSFSLIRIPSESGPTK